MMISFHVPGLKTHRLNTLVLAPSSFADPVDFIIGALADSTCFQIDIESVESVPLNVPRPSNGIAGRCPIGILR